MISFCVLEEFLGLLSNSYGRTVSDGIPSIHDSKNLEDYKQNLKEREKRIAKKTGTENTIKNFFTGKNSEAIKNAERMAKRHKALVKRAADKHFKAASRLKTADTALTLAGLGAAAYALKKRGDAEQNKKKEK